MADWKNRIARHADVDPASLIPHDRNWRTHPAAQRAALDGLLSREVGWVQDVVVSQRSGRILDGHLRVVAPVKSDRMKALVEAAR